MRVGRDVQQCLLEQRRDQPRVRALRDHCRGPAALVQAPGQHLFAQAVVRAARRRKRGIVVAAAPGLVAGVQVERAAFAAELDERQARHVDREVDQEVALVHQRLQHGGKVAFLEPHRNDLHAQLLCQAAAVFARLHDPDVRRLESEMAQQQRQQRLADGAEADHRELAVQASQRFVLLRHPITSLSGAGPAGLVLRFLERMWNAPAGECVSLPLPMV